jgi:hypothetical protein
MMNHIVSFKEEIVDVYNPQSFCFHDSIWFWIWIWAESESNSISFIIELQYWRDWHIETSTHRYPIGIRDSIANLSFILMISIHTSQKALIFLKENRINKLSHSHHSFYFISSHLISFHFDSSNFHLCVSWAIVNISSLQIGFLIRKHFLSQSQIFWSKWNNWCEMKCFSLDWNNENKTFYSVMKISKKQ